MLLKIVFFKITFKVHRNEVKMSRRRPTVVRTLTSSRLGELYETLVEKKISLLNGLQKEHEARMQILELEKKLKKHS